LQGDLADQQPSTSAQGSRPGHPTCLLRNTQIGGFVQCE